MLFGVPIRVPVRMVYFDVRSVAEIPSMDMGGCRLRGVGSEELAVDLPSPLRVAAAFTELARAI